MVRGPALAAPGPAVPCRRHAHRGSGPPADAKKCALGSADTNDASARPTVTLRRNISFPWSAQRSGPLLGSYGKLAARLAPFLWGEGESWHEARHSGARRVAGIAVRFRPIRADTRPGTTSAGRTQAPARAPTVRSWQMRRMSGKLSLPGDAVPRRPSRWTPGSSKRNWDPSGCTWRLRARQREPSATTPRQCAGSRRLTCSVRRIRPGGSQDVRYAGSCGGWPSRKTAPTQWLGCGRRRRSPGSCRCSPELSALGRACQGRSFEARRDAAIVEVFLATGGRRWPGSASKRLAHLSDGCCQVWP
jgi:hypothetical protein